MPAKTKAKAKRKLHPIVVERRRIRYLLDMANVACDETDPVKRVQALINQRDQARTRMLDKIVENAALRANKNSP